MSKIKKFELVDTGYANAMDRQFRSLLAHASKGMSPLDLALVTVDWISHLAISPGRQLRLVQSFVDKLVRLGIYSIESLVRDSAEGPASAIEQRMSGEAWQKWPFKVFAQAHQCSRDWLQEATTGIDGVRPEHEAFLSAIADQILDLLSPANGLLTNPEALKATREEKGKNLARGLRLLVQDLARDAANTGFKENDVFKVGQNLATTPGKVVFRNDLIELIQYSPATERVGAEPLLITPAWILKYYVLDLSPENSMVKYLVEQGKTVFIISWKNPDEEDKGVSFEDYVHSGQMAAIDAVNAICPGRKIHAVGYCIGGTLLSIAAATMARDDDDRLASITLFAAQVDFSDAGDISLLISPSQLSYLEKIMYKRGFLGSEYMGGAFGSLRAHDMIYSNLVNRYLMGKPAAPNDLLAWNADGTRMPYQMHSQYLQQLYLHNQLSRNKFHVNGRTISMADVRVPIFLLGSESDQVAPWRSVFKMHYLTQCELTFALTNGGHNAGIICGAENHRRHYRIATRIPGDKFINDEGWMANNEVVAGSWWPAWNDWLEQRSSEKVKPPAMGSEEKGYRVLREAPGEYVFG